MKPNYTDTRRIATGGRLSFERAGGSRANEPGAGHRHAASQDTHRAKLRAEQQSAGHHDPDHRRSPSRSHDQEDERGREGEGRD